MDDSSLWVSKGAFHLSELTGQTIPIVIWIFFLVNTIPPGQLNST